MAAWPSVVAAVFGRVNTVLPAVRVSRGRPVTQDTGDVVLVAVQEADDLGWTSAGAFQQTMQSFGGHREEVGAVNCVILTFDGDGDQTTATAAAFGYLEAIEADVRADPTLGLNGFDYVVAETSSVEIRENPAEYGAATALPFVISYKIRI